MEKGNFVTTHVVRLKLFRLSFDHAQDGRRTVYPPDQVLIFNTRMGMKRQGRKERRGETVNRGNGDQKGWMGGKERRGKGRNGEGGRSSKGYANNSFGTKSIQ
jgi:hypothetical protein